LLIDDDLRKPIQHSGHASKKQSRSENLLRQQNSFELALFGIARLMLKQTSCTKEKTKRMQKLKTEKKGSVFPRL
jgi:hypothetical protein